MNEEKEGQRDLSTFQKSYSPEILEQASELRSNLKVLLLFVCFYCFIRSKQGVSYEHWSSTVWFRVMLALTLIISTAPLPRLIFSPSLHLQCSFLPLAVLRVPYCPTLSTSHLTYLHGHLSPLLSLTTSWCVAFLNSFHMYYFYDYFCSLLCFLLRV